MSLLFPTGQVPAGAHTNAVVGAPIVVVADALAPNGVPARVRGHVIADLADGAGAVSVELRARYRGGSERPIKQTAVLVQASGLVSTAWGRPDRGAVALLIRVTGEATVAGMLEVEA